MTLLFVVGLLFGFALGVLLEYVGVEKEKEEKETVYENYIEDLEIRLAEKEARILKLIKIKG